MSNNSARLPRRRPGIMSSLASHAGVALQNWAARREAATVESLQFQERLSNRLDAQTGALHDGLLR
ncbi:hypothetical protein ACQCSX_10035 [Pseudarthrobacter sp. P1]|uniref:hypothetical protein n=1 Tax=Pseudarthrobacter sp. P1 TaxID=3418418 RepID=UPI003CFB08DF